MPLEQIDILLTVLVNESNDTTDQLHLQNV